VSSIAVVHLGNASECFVASSVTKGLCREFKKPKIYWVVKNNNCKKLFLNNKNVKQAVTLSEFYEYKIPYDVLINFSPEFGKDFVLNGCKDCRGFNFSSSAESLYDVLYGEKSIDSNIFQVYYRLADLSWRGDGADIQYYPKSRSKKNRAGIAIAHAGIRNYVLDNLDLSSMKTWLIPFKKNIFKKMDEINRCHYVVTDNFLTMNLAVYLRKYVYYLQAMSLNTKPEFFGKGEIVNVPTNML